jgi:hypothetical protein
MPRYFRMDQSEDTNITIQLKILSPFFFIYHCLFKNKLAADKYWRTEILPFRCS